MDGTLRHVSFLDGPAQEGEDAERVQGKRLLEASVEVGHDGPVHLSEFGLDRPEIPLRFSYVGRS